MGISLYAILVHCNEEAIGLFHFHMNLLNSSTIRTIIQATKNNIVLKNIEQYENQENLKQFYLQLKTNLDLEIGNVLGSLLPTSKVKAIEDKGWPFMTTVTNVSLPGKTNYFTSFKHIFSQTCL